jgi:hypothetical protein
MIPVPHGTTNMTGTKFFRLTVLGLSRIDKTKWGTASFWECLCECGNHHIVHRDKLNKTKSCGCLKKEIIKAGANFKHGFCVGGKKTPEYDRWGGMKDRCYCKTNKKYPRYGGRGITVCKEWIDDFPAFFAYMGPCKEGDLLDRIEADGNYEPGNCRWVTPAISNRNYSTRNRNYTHNGETKCLKDWAAHFGINYATLWQRIKDGLSFEKAVAHRLREKILVSQVISI